MPYSGYYKYKSRPAVRNFGYKKKDYKNPYFQKPKSKKNGHFYYSAAGIFLAASAWIYFLYFSPVFIISEWEINGLGIYEKIEVETELRSFMRQKRLAIFPNSNIFSFKPKNFTESISAKFAMEKIEIKKFYPNKIILAVTEKQPKAAVYNGNKIFIISSDGTIVMEKEGMDIGIATGDATTSTDESKFTKEKILTITNDASGKGLPPYPIFCDAWQEMEKAKINDKYLAKEPDVLMRIYDFTDNVSSRTDLKIRAVALESGQTGPKITIYTENNWVIYINPRENGTRQYNKLNALLSDKLKDRGQALEYIDLRFGDRVYIK
jgi:cell division septal protein FtsQ